MRLIGAGSIRIAGGCEVFTEGLVRLLPEEGGVRLTLENLSPYGFFCTDDGAPHERLEVVWNEERSGALLERLTAILSSEDPPEFLTTNDFVVEVDLPLDTGTIATRWEEAAGERDVDRLADAIHDIFREIVADRDAGPAASREARR